MIKNCLDRFRNLDVLIKKIMKSGFIFSFFVSIVAILILLTYSTYYISPDLFYVGISLFKTSIMFTVAFIIGGIAFDTIKKQIG